MQFNYKTLNQKMKLLLLFVILTASSCKYKAPDSELCGITEETISNGKVVCNDPRLRKEDYERGLKVGDVCTNVIDFVEIKEYCGDLRQKLIKCERN